MAEKRRNRKLPLLLFFLEYLNPVRRLGSGEYSTFFPSLATLITFFCIEILSDSLLKNPSLYSIVVITISIVGIIYFSFRDGLRGGYIVTAFTVIYYLYIIFFHHYQGQQLESGIITTIILGFLYFCIATTIGFLKNTIDALVAQEMDARLLAESGQRRLQTIIDQIPAGILIVNKDKSVQGNRQLEKILGKKPAEILRNDREDSPYVSEKGKALAPARWPISKALQGKVVRYEEMELARDDKRHLAVSVSAAPIYQHKRFVGAVSIIEDITKKKQDEEEKYRLATVLQSSEDAILTKKLDGTILSWNKGAERMFGYTQKKAIGQHITFIVPQSHVKEEKEILQKLKQGIGLANFETMRKARNGKLIPVSVSITPVRDLTGRIIGGADITRDITREKALEQQKDNFIGIASHELKTPVTSLKGFTQILQILSTRKKDKKMSPLLDKMNMQLNKLTGLIEDLLDITKIQKGHLPFTPKFYDFDRLLSETVDTIGLTTESHKIRLSGKVGRQVYGDEGRTEQVLVNLLSNAIKYSPKSAEVQVRVVRKKFSFVVSVQDFGIGISKEKQKHVFEQFFRGTGDTHNFPGLGLGLYIAHEIVRRLKGKIWLESTPGRGTTFFVQLPIRKRKIE